jgi:hypothetical protein
VVPLLLGLVLIMVTTQTQLHCQVVNNMVLLMRVGIVVLLLRMRVDMALLVLRMGVHMGLMVPCMLLCVLGMWVCCV